MMKDTASCMIYMCVYVIEDNLPLAIMILIDWHVGQVWIVNQKEPLSCKCSEQHLNFFRSLSRQISL